MLFSRKVNQSSIVFIVKTDIIKKTQINQNYDI